MKKTIHVIQIMILLVLVGVGAALYGPIRMQAQERAEALRIQILGDLERTAGIRVSYSGISPALLSAVTIRNLRIEFNGGEFTARRLRVFYDAQSLFDGDDSPLYQNVVTKVAVTTGALNLDFNAFESNSESSQVWEVSQIFEILRGKVVTLADLDVDLILTDGSLLTARRVNAEVKDLDGLLEYKLDGRFVGEIPSFPLGSTELLVDAWGRLTSNPLAVNGRLNIGRFRSDLLVLAPLSLDYTFAEEALTFRRVGDSRPLDFDVRYSPDSWSVAVVSEHLPLTSIMGPGVDFQGNPAWFSSELDGTYRISGPQLRYTGDGGIRLPEQAIGVPLDLKLRFTGDSQTLAAQQILARTSYGTVDYSGLVNLETLMPQGSLQIEASSQLSSLPLFARFNLQEDGNTVSARTQEFRWGEVELDEFQFVAIREEQALALSFKIVPPKPVDSDKSVDSGVLLLDGHLDFTGQRPRIRAFALAQSLSFSSWPQLPSNLAILSQSRLDASARFETGAKGWALDLEQTDITWMDSPQNHVSLRGRITPGQWDLNSLDVKWQDFTFQGRGMGKGSSSGGLAEGRIVLGNRIYPIDAQWFSDGQIQIDGAQDFSISVGPRRIGGRSLLAKSQGFVIPLDGKQALQLDVDLRGLVGKSEWNLFANRVALTLIQDSGEQVALEFAGTMDANQILLPSIAYLDSWGSLAGNSVITLPKTPKGELQGRLALQGEGERYDFYLSRINQLWDASLIVNQGRLERIPGGRMAGRANIQGEVSGDLTNPWARLSLSTSQAQLDGEDLEASAQLSLEDGRLRIQDIRYSRGGLDLQRGLLFANLKEGSLRGTGELDATFNQVPLSTGFSLAVDFFHSLEWAEIQQWSQLDYKGTLATRPVRWDDQEHLPGFTFQFDKTENQFAIRSPDSRILDLTYRFSDGQLRLLSGSPLPVAVQGGGTIFDGQLDLDFPILEIDPTLINYVMVRDPILLDYHVVFQGGRFIGNLKIEGSAADPDFLGDLKAENLLVDTPYTYASISPASTNIRLRGKRIEVDTIEVPIGGGVAYGGGYLDLERWSLTDFDMTYGGKGLTGVGVPVYYPLLGIYLDGAFTGEVRMTGDSQGFALSGEITFPELKASLGSQVVPVPQGNPNKYPKQVLLDFDFVTGNNCTFYLPNEQLKIVQAAAEPGSRVNLNYVHIPKTLSVTGSVPVKSGNIFYFDRDFRMTEGEIVFNESLGNFDPVLSLRAETRVPDDSGEDVAVALVFDGPVRSGFNPRIEARPARTELEILALFGQAVVPYAQQGENDANAVLLATGGVVSQLGLVQPFENALRERLNLDMVTIRTDIIENALAEGFSQGSASGTRPSAGLGRYLDNTSLFVGKYIGDALFISGTVTANYSEGQRLRSVFGGLEFEASVSLEMETPFFNVEWAYVPDPFEDQFFVANNRISLKWQFKY